MKSMFKGALGAFIVVLALSGLTAASALAAGAPTAETKAATGVTETTAVANGTVNPNGAETKVYAEYGPTISYGAKSREHNAGSGTGTEGESWNLTGLTPKTTYHFRVVAKNAYGTSYGADMQFFTSAYPPGLPEVVVSEGNVSEVKFTLTGSSVQVKWGGGTEKVLTCTSAELSGHFINSKEFEGTMTWYRCFSKNASCSNGKEEVQSEPLTGGLGYINKAKKEVGLRLSGKSSATWANNVSCFGYGGPLTGSLTGQLNVPVNTKIHTSQSLWIDYTQKEGKEITGELGGQLIYSLPGSSEPFGFGGDLSGKANKELEVKA